LSIACVGFTAVTAGLYFGSNPYLNLRKDIQKTLRSPSCNKDIDFDPEYPLLRKVSKRVNNYFYPAITG